MRKRQFMARPNIGKTNFYIRYPVHNGTAFVYNQANAASRRLIQLDKRRSKEMMRNSKLNTRSMYL